MLAVEGARADRFVGLVHVVCLVGSLGVVVEHQVVLVYMEVGAEGFGCRGKEL